MKREISFSQKQREIVSMMNGVAPYMVMTLQNLFYFKESIVSIKSFEWFGQSVSLNTEYIKITYNLNAYNEHISFHLQMAHPDTHMEYVNY